MIPEGVGFGVWDVGGARILNLTPNSLSMKTERRLKA